MLRNILIYLYSFFFRVKLEHNKSGYAGKPIEGTIFLWGESDESVEIKGELIKLVKSESKVLNIKSEEVIIRALKSYFRERRIDKIQEKLSEHFRERGILTEEDLFNEVS